jgi:hypothetical protein
MVLLAAKTMLLRKESINNAARNALVNFILGKFFLFIKFLPASN